MTLILVIVLLGASLLAGAFLGRRREANEAHRVPSLRPGDAFLALVVMVSTPVAAWWLIGDQSTNAVRSRDRLDFIIRAPEIKGWIVAALGAMALVATVVCAGYLVRSARQGKLDQRWMLVVGLLASGAFLIAAIGRVVTAGTIGANIGGGMAIMFGLPVVFALVGCALFRGHQIRRSVDS